MEISKAHPAGTRKGAKWVCKCDCGNEKIVPASTLKTGQSRSCGCLKREIWLKRITKHGFSKDVFYQTWCGMMQRCYNSKQVFFHRYGGRGISVCEEWHQIEIFIDWCKRQGEQDDGATLERFDNDGNYHPDNCIFSSRSEQARNRENNLFVDIDGIDVLFIDLVEQYGVVSYGTAFHRISYWGWDPLTAAMTPTGLQRREI